MFQTLGKFLTNRIAIFSLLTISVIALFAFVISYLNALSTYFYFASLFLSVSAAFEIMSRNTYPEYKIAWILVVAGLPVFGFAFYLVLGRKNISSRKKQNYQSATKNSHFLLLKDKSIKMDKTSKTCERIIYSHCKMPAFCAKSISYYPSAKKFYTELKKSLQKAKSYIFLEYFIIKPGMVWNSILNILKQKASQGIDVRIIYDDFGSVLNLPRHYPQMLAKFKIKAMRFNTIIPLLDARMNIRNHRKNAIIDGNVAFISGANIADEYANISPHFGNWKDFGAKITGNAANSFAISFLDSWKTKNNTKTIEKFLNKKSTSSKNIVIPFQDSPMFKSSVYEDVLLNLIYRAKSEIKIATPYLVPTSELQFALTSAARRGVNVSICIPGIPDKASIHQMTKAFASSLAQNGVNLYSYSPGFLHSKLFLMDKNYSVVGTSNLDLRSIHSNHEINMFVQSKSFSSSLSSDFKNIINKSQQILPTQRTNPIIRLYRSIIKLFAPLM